MAVYGKQDWNSDEEKRWWEAQAARKPKRYQVWRLSGNGISALRMIVSTGDVVEAVTTARGDRPSMVLDLETVVDGLPGEVLRCNSTETGPLAYIPPPKQFTELLKDVKTLASAPDGYPVSKIGLSAERARDVAKCLRRGEVKWRDRVMAVDRRPVTIEVVKNRAYVRLGLIDE